MAAFTFQVNLDRLSKSQQAIANYVAGALAQIPYCTDEEIAGKVGVSTATVSRFWRAIGYANLKDFKKRLLESEHATPARKVKHILSEVEQESADIVDKLTELASSNLAVTAKRVERAQFEGAVDAIHRAETVYLYGGGASACLTELMRFRLNRIGIRAVCMASSGSELLETMAHAGPGDTVLLLGFVRRTPELAVLLDYSREAGYTTVLLTDLLVSEMLEQSDYALRLDRGELEGFHSLTAPVAILEALIVGVTQRRGRQALDKLEKLHSLRKRYAAQLPK